MLSNAKRHLLKRIAETPISPDPFPHILVDRIFPPDFYEELQRHLLPDEEYKRLVDLGRVSDNYSPHRLCFMQHGKKSVSGSSGAAFWQDFFAAINDHEFLTAWAQLFGAAIQQRFATDLKESYPTGEAHLRPEIFLMRDKDGYELRPHMDSKAKAISALFYLPATDEKAGLGTSLYRKRDGAPPPPMGQQAARDQFELVETVAYLPNRMLAFPNLPGAYHGVEPIAHALAGRDVLIYDVKFVPPQVVAG